MSNRFSWVLAGRSSGPDLKSDLDLSRGQPIAVLPSLGSLFPGWLLAVPRKSILSLSRLSSQERIELLSLCKALERRLTYFSSKIYFFEHGPSAESNLMGCGVDQAHLHLVPINHNLLDHVLIDESVIWSKVDNADPWAAVPQGREYYMISDGVRSYIGIPLEPQSQYFRKKLAALNGTPDEWDYRKWPHYEHIERTIKHFLIEHVGEAA